VSVFLESSSRPPCRDFTTPTMCSYGDCRRPSWSRGSPRVTPSQACRTHRPIHALHGISPFGLQVPAAVSLSWRQFG
jgi:hypothetical protein